MKIKRWLFFICCKIGWLIKLDKIVNTIDNFINQVRIFSYEINCGCKINYVNQGRGGVIISGDLKQFKIHPTSHLKSGTFIESSGGVEIGKYFHCGRGLTMFSSNHNYKSHDFIPYGHENILRPIIIGDAVWVGANVTIAPGAQIGHGVIISTGSVVFGKIPDCAIVRGNPAEIIAYRDKNIFWKLYQEQKFI